MKYGTTWADLEGTPRAVSWRGIRSSRATPPGNGGGERRQTLATALDQAEQLFAAAEAVEPTARPLVMFYGLSQAGRAIVAARAGAGATWTYRGHGLREPRGANSEETTAADFCIEPHGDGAFKTVADTIGSSTLTGGTRLGDLWTLVPETARFPLPEAGPHRLLSLDISSTEVLGVPINGHISNLPPEISVPHDPSEERARIERFLGQYPSLSGYAFVTESGQPVGLQAHDDGTGSVPVTWPRTSDGTSTSSILRNHVAVTYYGTTNAYPCIDGSGRALHPLIVWWGILFGLSVLARYEPQAWGRAIDINASGEAIAIEHLLDSGLDTLPELLLRTMRADA